MFDIIVDTLPSMALRISYPVVLASASPRRQELLRRLIPEFLVDAADIDEDALTVADPWQTAQRLAREKALAVYERHPDSLVIAGDTVVGLPDRELAPGAPDTWEAATWVQLSKPRDASDAERMLATLAGRTHVVVTGIALRWPRGLHSFAETSWVTFKAMTAEQISAYVVGGEPMDKAGSYGIQGMASGFVSQLEGSLENVIGLPVEPLEEALRQVK